MPSVLSEKHLFRYEQGWPQGQERKRHAVGSFKFVLFCFSSFFFLSFSQNNADQVSC